MDGSVTMRVFGLLHLWCTDRGLPTSASVPVAPDGERADTLAQRAGWPLELIEAVFVNRVVRPLSYRVMPGDRVAFVPVGVPGPHRLYLGIWDAGREE